MFVHSWLAFDPSTRNYTILKVMTEEERKEFQVDKIVELLQRELIEVRVDCVEGEAAALTLLSNHFNAICEILHSELDVFWI